MPGLSTPEVERLAGRVPWVADYRVIVARKAARNDACATSNLLIDTDPGVDDALAILMAHAHADVAALTIAAGNVGLAHTTRNALKLIETIGRRYAGVSGLRRRRWCFPREDAGFVHGADGFGDTGYSAGDACRQMTSTQRPRSFASRASARAS